MESVHPELTCRTPLPCNELACALSTPFTFTPPTEHTALEVGVFGLDVMVPGAMGRDYDGSVPSAS